MTEFHIPPSEPVQQLEPDQQIEPSEPEPVQWPPPLIITGSLDESTQFDSSPDRPQRKKRPQHEKSKKGKRKMPRKLRTVLESAPPELSHHRRRCLVCRHPDQEAIEQEFLGWRNPGGTMGIATYYKIPERSIYHHAHATGLLARRARTLRFALEHIIESAENVHPTASAVIRAVRAYTCLTSDGRWIEPPSRVTFSVNRALAARSAKMAAQKSAAPVPAPADEPEPDSVPVTTE